MTRRSEFSGGQTALNTHSKLLRARITADRYRIREQRIFSAAAAGAYGHTVEEVRILATDSGVAYGMADAFMLHRQQLDAFLRVRHRGGAGGIDIEDLLHELWLRCHKVDIRGIDNPKSYLFRAAHNLVVDRGRSALRGRRYEDAWDYTHNRASGGSEPPTAERRLLARERLGQVDRALRAVGERAAWIFRRYRIDGVLQTTIADELGVSLSTVEKDLRKAYEAVVAVRELSDED